MKKTYIIAGLVLALILAWLLLRRPAAKQSVAAAIDQKNIVEPSPSAVSSKALVNTPVTGPSGYAAKRIEQVRGAMNDANQSISFYGKVIDQDGAPLPDVKVTLGVRRTSEILPGVTTDNSDRFILSTDQNGLFRLTNEKGALLGVKALEKAGYETSPKSMRYFWYYENEDKKYSPNADSPEVFRMWRLAGAETLLRKGIGTRIHYDGRTVIFDLQAEREVRSGGDIKVTLLRTPIQIRRGQDEYDWMATIEAMDGGVIISNDEFMYRAPESGYQSKLTILVSAQDPKWSSDQEVSFYLKSRGMYARVRAKFMTDSEKPTTGFDIEAYINPAPGHRNLEYNALQGVATL